jgi:hypothetical protein
MSESDAESMVRAVFDALPSLVYVVDEDVRIQACNAAAGDLLDGDSRNVLKERAGDVLHCLHATEGSEGCGHGPLCHRCIIRNSVAEVFRGKRAFRRRARLELVRGGTTREMYVLITVSAFRFQGRALALLVLEDFSDIAELRRMIPICSVCKKVRDGDASWIKAEAYLRRQWDVDFTHGLCPDCYAAELKELRKDDAPGAPPEPTP